MIDFDRAKAVVHNFAGSERKTSVVLDGVVYMLKFPDPVREKKKFLSYKNNQFSEYIGSHIFQMCGISAQDTVLGTLTTEQGRKKLVVGCVDFTQDGSKLIEFERFGDALLDSEKSLDVSIESVRHIVKKNELITNKEEVLARFWDMFVVDALIGNIDRHMENWGLLLKDNQLSLAPVYDCGSSLSALTDEKTIATALSDPTLFKNLEYNVRSVYKLEGKTIFYHEIFRRPPRELEKAILRLCTKIDMPKIASFINGIELLDATRKTYLIESLTLRYQQILVPAFKQAIKKEQAKPKNAFERRLYEAERNRADDIDPGYEPSNHKQL